MWWLLLLTIVAVIGYFFYSREGGASRLSRKEAEIAQDLLDRERAESGARKQGLVDRAAKEGKTIPVAQIVEPLEKSKAEHKGDVQYAAAVDRTINELKRRYGAEIPVDEAYNFAKDDEEKP